MRKKLTKCGQSNYCVQYISWFDDGNGGGGGGGRLWRYPNTKTKATFIYQVKNVQRKQAKERKKSNGPMVWSISVCVCVSNIINQLRLQFLSLLLLDISDYFPGFPTSRLELSFFLLFFGGCCCCSGQGNKKKNQTIEKKILGDEKNQKKKMTVNRFHRTRTKEKKIAIQKKE